MNNVIQKGKRKTFKKQNGTVTNLQLRGGIKCKDSGFRVFPFCQLLDV